MKTWKQKALGLYYASYLVNKELTFGCEIEISGCDSHTFKFVSEHRGKHGIVYILGTEDGDYTIIPKPFYTGVIGHPPQLQDWLRLLGEDYAIESDGRVIGNVAQYIGLSFDMKTGQPATESDYQALVEILEGK